MYSNQGKELQSRLLFSGDTKQKLQQFQNFRKEVQNANDLSNILDRINEIKFYTSPEQNAFDKNQCNNVVSDLIKNQFFQTNYTQLTNDIRVLEDYLKKNSYQGAGKMLEDFLNRQNDQASKSQQTFKK